MSVSLQSDPALQQGYILVNGQRIATLSPANGLSATNISIPNNSVTEQKIANGAVTASKVAGNAFFEALPPGATLRTISEEYNDYRILTQTSTFGNSESQLGRPTTSGGSELITASIAPTSASNKILITASFPALVASATQYMQVALFRNNLAIQLDNGYFFANRLDRGAYHMPASITVLDTPNTLANIVYSIRISGRTAASTFYINGITAGQRGGGAYKVQLILQEIKG